MACKQWKLISCSSGDWEVRDQGTSRFSVWCGPTSWFINWWLVYNYSFSKVQLLELLYHSMVPCLMVFIKWDNLIDSLLTVSHCSIIKDRENGFWYLRETDNSLIQQIALNISKHETLVWEVRDSNGTKDELPYFTYHLQLEYKFHKGRGFACPVFSFQYGPEYICTGEHWSC